MSIDIDAVLSFTARNKIVSDRMRPILMKVVDGEAIYNPEYNELKYLITCGVEKIWRAWLDSLPTEKMIAVWKKITFHPYPYQIPSVLTKIDRANFLTESEKKDFTEKIAFLVPFCEKLIDLKDKTIKGRRPSSVPSKPKYEPPPASISDMARVDACVVEVTDIFFQSLVSRIKSIYDGYVSMYLSGRRNSQQSPLDFFTPGGVVMPHWDAIKVVELIYRIDGSNGTYTIIKDSSVSSLQLAEEAAERIRNNYRRKMQAKMASIVGERAAVSPLKSVCVGEIRTCGVTFEGALTLTFEDGSGFDVYNNAVHCVSYRNLQFYRFPTTFRNVMGPGGRKLGNMSEKQMNEEFTKAKVP